MNTEGTQIGEALRLVFQISRTDGVLREEGKVTDSP